MLNRSILKTSLLLAGLAILGACSDNSSDDGQINPSITTEDTELDSGSGDNVNPTSEDTQVDVVVGDSSDLANPIPQIATLACGDLPISATRFSSTQDAPAMITANEVVRGRVDPDSATNNEHFWNIDLQPGYYHLVLDTRRVDDGNSNIGLELYDIKGPGEADDLLLLQNSKIFEYGYRQSFFFEKETATPLNLRVNPIFGAEDYTFGIFQNGSPVPSPRMEECPNIPTLSLDSTHSVVLPAYNSDADDIWFQLELELGDYILNSTATRVEGTDNNIIYTFRAANHFGENDRFEEVSSVIGWNAFMRSDSGFLTVSEDGLVWIRLRSGTDLQNIELTLSPAN